MLTPCAMPVMQAALADMRIPAVEVAAAEDGEEPELDVDDDPNNSVRLDCSQLPVVVTVSQVSWDSVMLQCSLLRSAA